jgi:hypothetical protein
MSRWGCACLRCPLFPTTTDPPPPQLHNRRPPHEDGGGGGTTSCSLNGPGSYGVGGLEGGEEGAGGGGGGGGGVGSGEGRGRCTRGLGTSKRKLVGAWVILVASLCAGTWHVVLVGIELYAGLPPN